MWDRYLFIGQCILAFRHPHINSDSVYGDINTILKLGLDLIQLRRIDL